MLPPPTCTFTIPSIYDDTKLDCRVYTPGQFPPDGARRRLKRCAVVAHPYAPLGGCQDDPIVHAVGSEFLRQGFVLGTFNFRGAGGSSGRTSWTGKAELHDYMSFVGFMVHYVHRLHPPDGAAPPAGGFGSVLAPIESVAEGSRMDSEKGMAGIALVLAGYSYGSLIATHLPPTADILARFANAVKGTAAAEIVMRATHLARQWEGDARRSNEAGRGRLQASDALRGSQLSIVVGGDECEPGSRRPSRESGRSFESLRRSLDVPRRKLAAAGKHGRDGSAGPTRIETLPVAHVPTPQTSYLLISPLLPPVSMFATMFTNLGLGQEIKNSNKAGVAVESKLVGHQSLAVYGDRDTFTSQRKLRKWAEGLAGQAGSRFRFREVSGAGHFWHEDGVEAEMRHTVSQWLQDRLTGASR